MPSLSSIFCAAVLLALSQAHGVILNAQGLKGSPASVGFKVNLALPRNCTNINPCQQDTTIIRDAEINANTVNECGRTELDGNIDIGENTENALAAGAVTQVKAGSTIAVTIHQVNADGAGPYTCDVIAQGNNGVITFPNVDVANNVPGVNGFSQAKEQDFVIQVSMPADLNCTGASAGNVCTVRCRNNALAGPFGGCFPVQQVDTTPSVNTPANIDTALSLEKVDAQVAQDIKDLPAALAANQVVGLDENQQAAAIVTSILGIAVTSLPASFQTLPTETAVPVATASTAADDAAAATPAADGKGSDRGNRNGFGKNFGQKRSVAAALRG